MFFTKFNIFLICTSYMILGVYGHFINMNKFKLPGLEPPKDLNV